MELLVVMWSPVGLPLECSRVLCCLARWPGISTVIRSSTSHRFALVGRVALAHRDQVRLCLRVLCTIGGELYSLFSAPSSNCSRLACLSLSLIACSRIRSLAATTLCKSMSTFNLCFSFSASCSLFCLSPARCSRVRSLAAADGMNPRTTR